MARGARGGGEPLRPRPVERVELRQAHPGRRLAAALALLALGVGLLAYSLLRAGRPEAGWVSVEGAGGAGDAFILLYELEDGGQYRALSALYTQAARRAQQLFAVQECPGVNNLWTLSHRPNETVEVDGALYDALAVLERAGSRALYLGPVYSRYEGVFFCQDDAQLADFDPRLSGAVREEYAQLAAFANDPDAIRVELLGEGRVRLSVSPAYLDYARREGVERFLDFGWMRNAFIADYLAGELAAQGYTRGALTSWDGFIRNLDGREGDYALQLYARRGEETVPVAVMEYRGPMSMVCLRDYPDGELDWQRFYTLKNGEVRTACLDPADGLCKSALRELTLYSPGLGCGELAAAALPVYAADALAPGAMEALAEEGIYAVYRDGDSVVHTDPDLRLVSLADGYRAALPTEK